MGEEYFKRKLPTWVPRTTAELQRQGQSMWAIRRDNVRVCKGVWIPRDKVAEWQSCVITRGRAQWLAAPEYALTGFAALAFLGLKYWADDAELVVASADAVPRRQPDGSQMARIETSRHSYLQMPDWYVRGLKCVDEVEALVSALKVVVRQEHTWYVPVIPGWRPDEIRGVQLVDAVRRLRGTNLRMDKIPDRAFRRIGQRWLKKVLKASSRGADSPQETLMRLIVREVVGSRAGEIEWEEQVAIYADGEMRGPGDSRRRCDEDGNFLPWLTVGDLVCRELKIVLFYDGEHHRNSRQHYRDAEIDATLQEKGFLVMRVTARMLEDVDVLKGRVLGLIQRAERDANS